MNIIKQDLEMELMVQHSDSTDSRSVRIFEAGEESPRDQTVLVTDHLSLEYAYQQSLRIKKKSGSIGLNELETEILLLMSKLNILRAHESSKL